MILLRAKTKSLSVFEIANLCHSVRYTSLGQVSDTLPNPHLKQKDGSYNPAYMLENGSYERAGRASSSS